MSGKAGVPSPTKHLGHIVGAPGELSNTTKIYAYYRALAAGSFELVAFDEAFDLARAVKSDAELESVRDSVRITWPVANRSPGLRMLRERISHPSTPTRSARIPMTPSMAKCDWFVPNPRIAPLVGLFV